MDDDGHRYFEEMAVTHVLGGLDESEGRVFRSHLLECGDCRARVGELRALAHDLADVERDERRVRAAKAVETKRRERDDDDFEGGDGQPSPRAARAVVLVGLVLLVLLAAWNFTLRGSISDVEAQAQQQALTMETLLSGTAWPADAAGAGVEAEVRATDERVAFLLTGIEPNNGTEVDLLGIYLMRGDDVVSNGLARVTDGRLLNSMALPDGDVTLVITNPEDAAPSEDGPDGLRLLDVDRPGS